MCPLQIYSTKHSGIEWLIWLFGVHFRFQLLEISGATFGDLTSFLVMRQKQQLMLTFCHLVLGRFAKHQSDEVYCDGPPEPLLEEPERQRATDPSLWQLVARLFGSFWASPQLGYPQIPYGVSTFPILSPLNWQVLEYRGINKFQTPPFDNMTISHIYIYMHIYIYI